LIPVSVSMDKNTIRRLDEIAARYGVSRSAVLRWAVAEFRGMDGKRIRSRKDGKAK